MNIEIVNNGTLNLTIVEEKTAPAVEEQERLINPYEAITRNFQQAICDIDEG